MRIELDLPDWCDERHIYIMAGIELAAYKNQGESTWHVKTTRCNQCGKCCMDLVDDGQYPLKENGDCAHLIQDGPDRWICGLGPMRPLPCGEGDLVKNGENERLGGICCIQYQDA